MGKHDTIEARLKTLAAGLIEFARRMEVSYDLRQFDRLAAERRELGSDPGKNEQRIRELDQQISATPQPVSVAEIHTLLYQICDIHGIASRFWKDMSPAHADDFKKKLRPLLDRYERVDLLARQNLSGKAAPPPIDHAIHRAIHKHFVLLSQQFPARTSPPSLAEMPDSMRQVQISILDEYSCLHDAFMETGCELARLAMTLGEESCAEAAPVANEQVGGVGQQHENGKPVQAEDTPEEILSPEDFGPLLVTPEEFATLVGLTLSRLKGIGTEKGRWPAAIEPKRGQIAGRHDFTAMAAWYVEKQPNKSCNVPTIDQARILVGEMREVSN